MRQKILPCCSRKDTKCANNVTTINCHDVSWWCSIYTYVDIYQIEDFDPTYIQIADRGSHVRFMNYEGALTTMTKALTTRLWHQSPGIWDLKRVGPGIWDVNNVEKPWPGYASQSKGAEWTRRCGWVWHWKVLHISVFHPQENSLKSMGYQISFSLFFQCWLKQTKPMQNWREFQFHPLLFNNSRGQHFGNLQGFPNKRHYFPPVQNS